MQLTIVLLLFSNTLPHEFILQYSLANADSKWLIAQIILSVNAFSDKTIGFH